MWRANCLPRLLPAVNPLFNLRHRAAPCPLKRTKQQPILPTVGKVREEPGRLNWEGEQLNANREPTQTRQRRDGAAYPSIGVTYDMPTFDDIKWVRIGSKGAKMTRKRQPTPEERLTTATDPNAVIVGRIFQAVGIAMEKDFPEFFTCWDSWDECIYDDDTQVLNFMIGGADVTVAVTIDGSFNMKEEKEAA